VLFNNRHIMNDELGSTLKEVVVWRESEKERNPSVGISPGRNSDL